MPKCKKKILFNQGHDQSRVKALSLSSATYQMTEILSVFNCCHRSFVRSELDHMLLVS